MLSCNVKFVMRAYTAASRSLTARKTWALPSQFGNKVDNDLSVSRLDGFLVVAAICFG